MPLHGVCGAHQPAAATTPTASTAARAAVVAGGIVLAIIVPAVTGLRTVPLPSRVPLPSSRILLPSSRVPLPFPVLLNGRRGWEGQR